MAESNSTRPPRIPAHTRPLADSAAAHSIHHTRQDFGACAMMSGGALVAGPQPLVTQSVGPRTKLPAPYCARAAAHCHLGALASTRDANPSRVPEIESTSPAAAIVSLPSGQRECQRAPQGHQRLVELGSVSSMPGASAPTHPNRFGPTSASRSRIAYTTLESFRHCQLWRPLLSRSSQLGTPALRSSDSMHSRQA